jgi:hypothetical protein
MMGYSRASSRAEGRAFSLTAEVGFCQRRFDLFAVTQIPFAIVGGFSPYQRLVFAANVGS